MKSESVSHLCPTLCDPMDCRPPGSSVHGILHAGILEWVAMPSSRGFSQPRDQIQVSDIAGGFFPIWATRGAHQIRWLLSIKRKTNKQTKTANVRVNISQDIEKQEPLCTDDGNVMWRIVSRLSKRNLHSVFIAALFTIVKRCKQPKFPSTDGSYLFFHQQTETINR